MKVNYKNLVENLIIIIVIGLLCGGIGGYVGYKSASKSALNVLEAQESIIEMAIEKNTSEIENTFTNEFKKIKNKKGEAINIVIDPTSKSLISNKDTTQIITVEQKKGFFKRLFKAKQKS